MPGFNLVRNSRVVFTTNVNAATGVVATSGATATNSIELQVMDGFSFSQNTETQVITVNEAGNTPARGQRTFNTALAPVDFSFSTYIRPSGSATVDMEEKVLWNALLSRNPIDTAGGTLAITANTNILRVANAADVTISTTAATNYQTINTSGAIAIGDIVTVAGIAGTEAAEWNTPAIVKAFGGGTAVTLSDGRVTNTNANSITLTYLRAPSGSSTSPPAGGTTLKLFRGAFTQHTNYSLIHSGDTNSNQLQKFGMVIYADGVTYAIDNCALDQATIDFGLDGIAMVQWTGKGTALRSITSSLSGVAATGAGFAGTISTKNTSANYITNKLSTVQLKSTFRGAGSSPTTYTLALTGGSLTIANNITYLTPSLLGVVNSPIGYFTGTRSISGSVTAYLKTGTGLSNQILTDILSNISTATETKYFMQIEVGGKNNSIRVELEMPAVFLQVPTIETQDVISTTINFTAQGADLSSSAAGSLSAANYDVENTNDLMVRYYSA